MHSNASLERVRIERLQPATAGFGQAVERRIEFPYVGPRQAERIELRLQVASSLRIQERNNDRQLLLINKLKVH